MPSSVHPESNLEALSACFMTSDIEVHQLRHVCMYEVAKNDRIRRSRSRHCHRSRVLYAVDGATVYQVFGSLDCGCTFRSFLYYRAAADDLET